MFFIPRLTGELAYVELGSQKTGDGLIELARCLSELIGPRCVYFEASKWPQSSLASLLYSGFERGNGSTTLIELTGSDNFFVEVGDVIKVASCLAHLTFFELVFILDDFIGCNRKEGILWLECVI